MGLNARKNELRRAKVRQLAQQRLDSGAVSLWMGVLVRSPLALSRGVLFVCVSGRLNGGNFLFFFFRPTFCLWFSICSSLFLFFSFFFFLLFCRLYLDFLASL